MQFYGEVEVYGDRRIWKNTQTIYAVPYDTPIPGYMCNVCCTLRLWGCKAPKSFDLEIFNTGAYIDVSDFPFYLLFIYAGLPVTNML